MYRREGIAVQDFPLDHWFVKQVSSWRHSVYNILGSTEMVGPEGPKSDARRIERGGVLEQGIFPHQLRGFG